VPFSHQPLHVDVDEEDDAEELPRRSVSVTLPASPSGGYPSRCSWPQDHSPTSSSSFSRHTGPDSPLVLASGQAWSCAVPSPPRTSRDTAHFQRRVGPRRPTQESEEAPLPASPLQPPLVVQEQPQCLLEGPAAIPDSLLAVSTEEEILPSTGLPRPLPSSSERSQHLPTPCTSLRCPQEEELHFPVPVVVSQLPEPLLASPAFAEPLMPLPSSALQLPLPLHLPTSAPRPTVQVCCDVHRWPTAEPSSNSGFSGMRHVTWAEEVSAAKFGAPPCSTSRQESLTLVAADFISQWLAPALAATASASRRAATDVEEVVADIVFHESDAEDYCDH